MSDPMAYLYEAGAAEVAAMLKCANLPYTGPESFLYNQRTEISRSADGETKLYADATPAIFYSLVSNGVTVQTGTGEEMLELLITLLKAIEEDMIVLYPYDRKDF